MGNEPSKPHSFLSDNSQRLARLAQGDKKVPSFKNIVILLSGLLIMLFVLSGIWIVIARRVHTNFEISTVHEPDFAFKVNFYKKARVLTSKDKHYLVAVDNHGYKTAIWVAKLDSPLGCGHSPSFRYEPGQDTVVHASCYEKDRLTYASDISVNQQVYQINMTSERPISTSDAKVIFSSVDIVE